MIIWNIQYGESEWALEIGNVTVLKGSHGKWYEILRLIEDFFLNKQSDVEIYEDMQLIHKKDWECLFIPYDAHLQLDKLNTKSPLKPILDEICDDLSQTPAYRELLNIWDDLRDELGFLNGKVSKYELSFHLEQLHPEHLKSFLQAGSISKQMRPIEYKKLLLNLFVDKVTEKKKLIIIELPELFADEVQIENFMEALKKVVGAGFQLIIVTNLEIEGNCNYLYREKIINNARIENLKHKVMNEVPFVCDEMLFNQAKIWLMKSVDNSYNTAEKIQQQTNLTESQSVLVFLILHHLNIKQSLDTTGFSPNIINFLQTY